MTEPRDENIVDLYELKRREGLRAFRVLLVTGAVETVAAHFYDNTNPAGHLNFMTVLPSGRRIISYAINARLWAGVLPVHDSFTETALDDLLDIEHGTPKDGTEKPKRPQKRIH